MLLMSDIDILEELGQNFIDYAWDTNNNKAFPSVFDGLKPGARACLWEMWNKKYLSSKPHVKSAKVAGGVIANTWPHNDVAIYETFVRMAQDFIENIPEVDFQGAAGNIILGQDSFASSRYTEVRLSPLAEEGMFQGINKKNVPMIWNFSGDEQWPQVLPAIFPRLLVNGSMGLGVGVAQNWATHGFTETADLILKYIKTGELDEDTYYPDFPTGGTIVNKDELSVINKTGKGKIILRGKYEINGSDVIFTEMPYQVYIEPTIEKIKTLVNEGKLDGIADVVNTSDKKRISLTVSFEKGLDVNKKLEELFYLTPLQTQINVNQNAIKDQAPELMTLKEVVDCYISHNIKAISKEHEFDFGKATARIEILEGLTRALESIDEIVALIRSSASASKAKEVLIEKYHFTEPQAKAILDMKLARLSNLEAVEVNNELQEKKEFAAKCKEIMESEDKQKEVLIERLSELVRKYGDKRRTKVEQKTIIKMTKAAKEKAAEVIEDVVITFNPLGYLQNIPLTAYKKNQYEAFKMTTADIILLFSNKGKYYRISPKDIKTCGIKDKGTAIGAIVKLEAGEKILAAFSTIINEKKPYIFFAMDNGQVKKTEKMDYLGATRNINGLVGCKTNGAEIISIQETNGDDVILVTEKSFAIHFHADEVRATGKATGGVKGINLSEGDTVISCSIGHNLSKSKVNGKEYIIPLQKRAGKGKQYV